MKSSASNDKISVATTLRFEASSTTCQPALRSQLNSLPASPYYYSGHRESAYVMANSLKTFQEYLFFGKNPMFGFFLSHQTQPSWRQNGDRNVPKNLDLL